MIATSRMLRRVMLAVVLLGAAACTRAAPRPAPAPQSRSRTVIVLGFDGFAGRYLDSDSAPALHALARTGVTTTRGMIPSFPTVTFSNFYALATGLYPDHSGIVNNRFYDPAYDSEFVYKDPIAHPASLRSARSVRRPTSAPRARSDPCTRTHCRTPDRRTGC